MTKKKSTTIKPKRFLADKVPKTGGPSPEQAIAKALNLSNELIDSYQGWAVDDLQTLWAEYVSVSSKPKDSGQHIRKLYDISHEIRGQGGSFGFPLVSVLGDSLCKHIENRTSLNQKALDIIKLHILAMKAVFRQGLKGQQPELKTQLAELLAILRAQ